MRKAVPSGAPTATQSPTAINANLPGFNASSQEYPFSCIEIATAIAITQQAFKIAKNVFKDTWKAIPKMFVKMDYATGRPRFKVPEVNDLVNHALDVAQLGSDVLQLKYMLDIMATVYGALGCWNSGTWQGLESWAGGGVAYMMSCRYESGWQISTDGGVSWQPVGAPVRVCEWVPV